MLIDVVLEVWDPRWSLHSLIFLAFFFLKYAGSAVKITGDYKSLVGNQKRQKKSPKMFLLIISLG